MEIWSNNRKQHFCQKKSANAGFVQLRIQNDNVKKAKLSTFFKDTNSQVRKYIETTLETILIPY